MKTQLVLLLRKSPAKFKTLFGSVGHVAIGSNIAEKWNMKSPVLSKRQEFRSNISSILWSIVAVVESGMLPAFLAHMDAQLLSAPSNKVLSRIPSHFTGSMHTVQHVTYAGAIRHPDSGINFNQPLPFLLPPSNDGDSDNDSDQSNDDDVIHPPNARKPPGRPPKRRLKDSKVTPEKRREVHCSRCDGVGHYESTCNERI